ncbi:hypothetical protein PVAND_013797 [Polypedilum vanderplanki]|uniref:Uncharacterized protein n=1 Tax=Polypedilum vanderplanki TaxID=319348 RepID=A0A9J6CRQ2_POLVA|nr:hypothetical protein PVAND_013797 [Polypedilum vanderplanki]
MISPSSLCDIKDRIHTNEEIIFIKNKEINLLSNINVVLKERHEIETNYNHLHMKYNQLKVDEIERKEKYDLSRKRFLSDLESTGQELCKEHAHILHQIEHITWHLEGCTRHRPCMGRQQQECPKKSAATSSCLSSSAPTCNRPSALANLKNTSERLIKSIVDLRKKIYITQDKLESELKRKREMEKKLSELRKDISRQKKSLSVRRSTHNHTPLALSTAATSLTHCPSIGVPPSQQTGHSCSSLPPIKKPILAK